MDKQSQAISFNQYKSRRDTMDCDDDEDLGVLCGDGLVTLMISLTLDQARSLKRLANPGFDETVDDVAKAIVVGWIQKTPKRLEDMTDEEIDQQIAELRYEGDRHMDHSDELQRYKHLRSTDDDAT